VILPFQHQKIETSETMHYDRAGNRITLDEWVALYTDDNKRVARTEVNGVTVSTVWLGMDHSLSYGPPLIFETMVFAKEAFGALQERYETEHEAILGHLDIVDRVRAGEITVQTIRAEHDRGES